MKSSKDSIIPDFVTPSLATLTTNPFDSKDWLYEIKYEGYRTITRIEGNNIDLLSINNISLNDHFPPIVKNLMFLGFDCMLDGEIVVLNNDGVPDAQLLKAYEPGKRAMLVYFVFDILYYQKQSLLDLPLINRKKILESLPLPFGEQLQLCQHISGDGIELFQTAKKMGLNGIIAKKASSRYNSGNTNDWLEIAT